MLDDVAVIDRGAAEVLEGDEELDPVAAVYDRRIRIEGDFLLALRLAELFGGASALSDVDD